MSSQQLLIDIISALNSSKKKEKWVTLEKLTTLLAQDKLVKTLNQNSKSEENSITWDILFIRVNNAVLFLIDDSSTNNRQMIDKHVQIAQDVISQIIQKAFQEKYLLINPNLISSSVLAAFESDIRMKILGFVYLNLFNKYVVAEQKNWSRLKEENWVGMKNLCKNYFGNLQGMQSILFLEMLIQIIRFSSKTCQISHKFLDLLSFLKDIYASIKKFKADFENILLHLTNTLCLQLAVEFRYEVCEFMEEVFDYIISIYKDKNPTNITLVYHFFMATLNVHNPNGLWEKNTFYASDKKKWTSQIEEMFFLCYDEIKLILKNPTDREVDVDLLNLFVDVSHLHSHCYTTDSKLTEENNVIDEPGVSKKRKCSYEGICENGLRVKKVKLEGSLENLLINLNNSDCWFWLKFLELLLLKYPESVKEEYAQLVELLYRFLCEKKDSESVGVAIRSLKTLLELENSFTKGIAITNIQKLDSVWNNISTELIRYFHTKIHLETHTLIRSLLSHYKLKDIEPLIKLYCTGTIRPDFENFKTLCTICQHCILPKVLVNEKGCKNKLQDDEKVQTLLLKWLLQGEEKFPCKDLAKVLVALILKKFEEDIISVSKENVIICQTNINDFCKFITHSYLTVAFKNLKFLEESNAVESTFEIRIEGSSKKKLFDLLYNQYETVTAALNNEMLLYDEKLNALENCVWFVELICNLLSHFECGNDKCEDCTFLTNLLMSSLYICSVKSLNLLKVKFFDLTSFCKLYSGNFHTQVQKKIRKPEYINLDFLQYLFELYENLCLNDDSLDFDLNDSFNSISRFSQLIKNPKSALHFNSLNKKEKLIVKVIEMLCQYIITPGFTDGNCYQTILAVKIMKSLKSDVFFSPGSNFYTQIVLRVVCSFSKYDGITSSVLSDCLELMQTIFSSKTSDFEVILTGLQVLKDITNLVLKFPDQNIHFKFKIIIEDLKNLIVNKKNCGVKATCKFIELLAEICKVVLQENWELSDGSFCTILEEVIKFLKHPHHEIKLMAARHVGLLFVHNKNSTEMTVAWQKKMLKKLFEELKMNFERRFVKEKECELDYYRNVVSSVSLISWAGVICLSTYWRKKALFCLICFGFLYDFQKDAVTEIIKLICKELKINSGINYISHNFFYLFYKWVKKGYKFQNFPFYLLGYKTLDDFLSNHFSVVVNVYFEMEQLNIVNTLSSKLNKSVIQLLKECHPQLLAFVLPALTENVNSQKYTKAQIIKQFIVKEIGPKMSLKWLKEQLDEVIFNMIRNMHDLSYLLTLCRFAGNLKNDQNPMGFKASQIVETLENIETNKGKPLLGKIAVEAPSVVEKILRLLFEDVMTAVIYEEKVFAFYKYIFFVEILGKATRKGYFYRGINIFIIRDVVYSVAAIMAKTEDEILVDLSCECFKKLGNSYLEEFNRIIGEFLPTITSSLIPAVRKGNKKALEVLSFFIQENFSKLELYIVTLDIFPSELVFNEINKQIKMRQVKVKNLKDAIKHFISAGRNKNSGCRIEGLKNLRSMLSENKLELKEMYEELRLLRGFSEDCKNSFLHQLICMLIELSSDGSTAIRTEAAKCLGELGPSDLTTLVLRPESNFTVSKSCVPAIYRLLKSAICILSDLSISDNYEVKRASSKALYAVLSTKQGREICEGVNEPLDNVEYLTPFLSKSNEDLQLNIKREFFFKKFEDCQLWRPDNHEKWIVNLVKSLLQSLSDSKGVIVAFFELITVNWQFAESIFPMCLDFVLSLKDEKCNEMIIKSISSFFEKYFNYRDKSPTTVNKTSVQCILNAVDYIRMQRNHEGVYQRCDLNVDFLCVAKAALHCSAFFTSIFYAELWFEDKRGKHNFYTDLNMICELFPEEGFALAEILRKCHFEIGNLDGIHGCGYMHMLNSVSEIEHYEHLKNWSLSMLHHDIQLSQKSGSEIGLLHSLEEFGMCYTLDHLIKTHSETPELTAIQYKCAARLLDWSHLDSNYKIKNNLTLDCFEKCYYFALKAFHDEDMETFKNEGHRTRKIVLKELAQCSLESSKNLYVFMTELQCLKELEEFAAIVCSSSVSELHGLFEKFDRQDSIKCSEFKLVESILTNRTIMLRDTWEKEKNEKLKNCLRELLCHTYHKLTVAARKEKKYEIAIRTLSCFNNIVDPPDEISGKMKVEKARILWERGDKEIGKFLLNHFLKKNEISGELKLKSLRIYGDWMASTKSENPREIIENFYLNSISQFSESRSRIHSFASLARFAYSIYELFNEYLSSPLFEIKQNLINTQQGLASELRQELGSNSRNREKRIAYQIAAKQSVIDENEIKNSKVERDSYLTLAIKYYLMTLKEGEKYNLVVFRIISLWLSNSSNTGVIQQLQKLLPQIPTYKFLCLLPQLVPRMADVCLISDLIEKILQDHPHHTLPLLFALKNSYEDLKYTGEKTTVSNPRILAVNSMLTKFESSKKLEHLIIEMRRLTNALIELANYNPSDRGKTGLPVNFPEHLEVRRIANLTSISVPSLNVPYNKNCTYDNIIGIREFEQQYYLVGGINLPKRITCVGSDGVRRPLLVKGRDDLRQDAVMQQVFTIMNSLLHQNKETSKRKLVIRTYKVVPLSQRSGIIEWCENTQPLSLYLTGPDGKSGAHKKYYPEDASALDCRCMIRTVFAVPRVTNEEKLQAFLNACKQLRPVFHNFFIEKFPAAGVWFERRLAYIHSVATSSMIGYILGIGDRHVHNILIDNATAEVIHIDLGIAFEQGKTLPTPETVPFRLTRDVVDGMGLSGVEGDFRISCVKAMEVLRDNQDTILTLLEVLLYDPLYTWTITPEKAYFIQNHTETSSTTSEKSSPDLETNKMAERALIRLKQKLQGTESGVGATTVEGQVRILINEARNPNNLCRLFHGWQAYL